MGSKKNIVFTLFSILLLGMLLFGKSFFKKFFHCSSTFPKQWEVGFDCSAKFSNPEIQDTEIIQPLFLTSSDGNRV